MALSTQHQSIVGLVLFGGSIIDNNSLLRHQERQHAIKDDASLLSLLSIEFDLEGLDPALEEMISFPGTPGSKRVGDPRVLMVVNFLLSTGRFKITRGLDLCRRLSVFTSSKNTQGLVLHSLKNDVWDVVLEYERTLIKEIGCELVGSFPLRST